MTSLERPGKKFGFVVRTPWITRNSTLRKQIEDPCLDDRKHRENAWNRRAHDPFLIGKEVEFDFLASLIKIINKYFVILIREKLFKNKVRRTKCQKIG